MKLFKKGNAFLFKIVLCLTAIALFAAGILITKVRSSAVYTVKQELKRIHSIDADAVTAYLPDGTAEAAAEEAVSLFLSTMQSKILSSNTSGDTAEVHVRITNLDTRILSHDICLALSSMAIRSMLLPENEEEAQLNDPYALLHDMITKGSYPRADTEAVFHLQKINRRWEIDHTAQLADELVSHLSSNLRDPHILTAEEILQIYLDTFDEMTWEDMQAYLQVEDIFSTGSPAHYQEIDQTYLNLVCSSYAYDIISVEEEEENAEAVISLTGPDLTRAMESYEEKLTAFAKTADSITSDSITLSDTAAAYLLESLQEDAGVCTRTVNVSLSNNGRAWQLVVDGDLTDALLGELGEALEVFS